MDLGDKTKIINRYNERLDRYGNDFRSLASGTDERRAFRYDVLCEVGIKDGSSVLDLGCGFGTLCEVIERKGIAVDYSGCDINPRLVEIARSKYPGKSFFVADIQTDTLPSSYDFIVASSAFNNILATDQYEYVHDIFRRAYELSRVGIAIDFMSSYVDFRSDEAFHYEPEKVFALAKSISKRVCLRHDYPLFEFCIYIYKDFKGWGGS